MDKKVGQYTIKARFYSDPDNFGETFVIIKSDNSCLDAKLEVGKKYRVTFEEIEDKNVYNNDSNRCGN